MRCAEFEARLNELLDERAPVEADAPLRLHADECDRCRQLLAGEETLFAGLEMWEPPALPSGFAQRVVAAYLAETNDEPAPAKAEPARGWPMWLARSLVTGILATGLVAMIALGIAWWNSRTPNGPNGEPPPIVNQPVVPPAPLPEKEPPQIVDRTPAPNAGGAPRPEEIAIADLLGVVQEQFPDAPERGSEFASQMVDGLRPLATPVGGVFNVLRRTLSGSKEPARPRKPQASNLIPDESGVA